MEIPKIVAPWQVLLRPFRYGKYVNDHALYRDADGAWYLVGITSLKGKPNYERYFVHARTPSLLKPMRETAKVIDTGTLAWAPAVTERDGNFYMFYGPSPLKLAVSRDSVEWFGHDVRVVGAPPMTCHRDHYVLKLCENKWIMYVSGILDGKSAISFLLSHDLLNWTYGGAALSSGADSELNPPWGAMESPCVIKRGNLYYLFLTYTDCRKSNYENTLVFASLDPENFGVYGEKGGAEPVARISAHASEIVTDSDGKTYLKTCGWRRSSSHRGKVMIAELGWE